MNPLHGTPATPANGQTSELSTLPDEELVRLAQQHGDESARWELVLRHLPLVGHFVGRPLWTIRFGSADGEDAQEEMIFGILEAIDDYNPARSGCSGPGSFRRLMHTIVRRRLANFITHHKRIERHFDHSLSAADLLEGEEFPQHVHLPNGPPTDPAEATQRQEETARLSAALAQFDDLFQRLWNCLVERKPLRVIADELDLSHDKAKRLCQRLMQELRVRLGSSVK